MTEKYHVTWNEVMTFVDKFEEYSFNRIFSGVYGIPRGGNILAVLLSHRLGIPLLGAPCKGCIVVDDIADSGITLHHFKLCGYEIATLFYKKESIVRPDFWLYEKKDQWIVFPWEKK